MTKEILYVYLGTNGTICSPVHLEDIYYTRRCRLIANEKKLLTERKTITHSITVPAHEVENWQEIDNKK